MIIFSQMEQYVKQFKNQAIAKANLLLIPLITKIILQNHPEAIKFLINEGLLTEK